MRALELAEECQDGYPLAPDAIAAATMLRRQHEAIVKLREIIESVERLSRYSDSYINDVAEQALKDTEDLK